jgi:hypothetical protein
VRAGDHSGGRRRRGFIIGELLVAVLLLAVAVSSLAALMYSVSRRSETKTVSACTDKTGIAESSCAARVNSGGGPKLLRSGCVAKSGNGVRGCNDSVAVREGPAETVVKSRTDSVSLSMIAKKSKPSSVTARPERGFIR